MFSNWKLICLIIFIKFVNIWTIENISEVQTNNSNNDAELKYLLHEIKFHSAKKFGIFSDSVIDEGAEEMKKATFNDGTEASINRKVSDYLFENDIVLNLDQANEILKEVKSGKKIGKRQAQPGLRFLWTKKRINYQFSSNEYDWKLLIRKALKHIEEETCMRFSENNGDIDKLQYFRGSGCWSNVGRQGGRQQVSIGYGCESMGIIAHETLHALGLWHEQSRYDRDDFVKIDWLKIFRGTQSNFEKRTPLTSDNMDMPYDLGSVMHYGSKAFSTDWSSYSIITKDSKYQQTIGQRRGISFKDAKMVNLRYCMDICRKQLNCKNGGYTDPNNCLQCRCPTGYSGTFCDKVAKSNRKECKGGELKANGKWQTIKSPPLSAGIDCHWRITAPADKKIELKFEKINFPCADVCDSYVEVKHNLDKIPTGARICCPLTKNSVITKEVGTDVLLNFNGDNSVQNGYYGFTLNYRILTADEQIVDEIIETTTQISTTTTTKNTLGRWSTWGLWSTCSHKCGGCGTRVRVRACYPEGSECEGSFEGEESCNPQVCTKVDAKKNQRCDGRLVMPCSLMEKLDFGTTKSDRTSNDVVHLPINSRNLKIIKEGERRIKRTKRFVDGDKQMQEESICEKKFSYNCPTNLLTINVDWKKINDNYQIGSCCPGYKPDYDNNKCILI
uniref:Metalloendopeptidase n=1 Tax=Parastrongyloides trichosuri TaxID=131310 RepID=A0A0N4ZTD4_PARTI